MGKPDLELEELDQRFAEVERTIQSACEIMGRLKEASPKIEKIHQMSSEIHEIKEKTLQEIKPVKAGLEGLADSHNQAARMLEELKRELRELQEAKELIWTELSKCAPSTRLSRLEEEMAGKSSALRIDVLEQKNSLYIAIAKLSDALENQDDRIKDLAVEVSKNAGKIKLALFLGTVALFLAVAALFLSR
jgi:myosin heavy subunit